VIFKLHLDAESEHLGRIAYYEKQRRGLGAKYLDDFDRTMERICDTPGLHKIYGNLDIRLVSFSTFPCSVIYRVIENAVQVLAIAHDRQRPGYWIARL
jgi:toxin ParE1/3/4